MRKIMEKLGVLGLCACLLFGTTTTVNAAKAPKNVGAYEAVFDADYYYNSNPDLQAVFGHNEKKLLNHFISYGILEGRSGCENFNFAIYKANYPDLQAAFGNNVAAYCTHYIQNGIREGRNATSLLSSQQTATQTTTQTTTAGMRRTSKSANPYEAVFDADYYYNSNPDLQAAFGRNTQKLFNHFVSTGILEGRSGCEDFNFVIYKTNYPDLQAAFGNDVAAYCKHYVQNGINEGRNATSLLQSQQTTTQTTAQTTIQGTVRGSCTTSFDPTKPRATNILISASRINGVVIQPGEEFSFNRAVLPRTRANGYVTAPVYSGGRVSTGIGGGICQVSSTLYSAMLDGGVPATERHAHSLPVSYLPSGRDATISGNTLDLKFVNIYNTPITIYAETDMTNGTVTVTLFQQ